MSSSFRVGALAVALILGIAGIGRAGPLGTAFAYQGRLTDGGAPASGSYDLEFTLFDAPTAGAQVGSHVLLEDVAVSAGLFTVSLDFGASPFGEELRWLEIGVRAGSSAGPLTTLAPRQPLQPVPTSLYSVSSGNVPWSGVSGKPAGFSDDEDDDSLAALPCSVGEAAVRGASYWLCSGVMPPTAGSSYYIQNQNASAQTASLNITGDAMLGGGLRLGSVGSSCAASTEGTLRYDSTVKEVQYCDGSAWSPLAPRRPVLWSGGCETGGSAEGWNQYCADRTEHNTATPDYLSVNSNGTFTFNRQGYYRVTFHTTALGTGYATIRFKRNAIEFYNGYSRLGDSGTSTWGYLLGDQIWPFGVGDTLTVEALNPGSVAFWPLTSAGYSRLQVTYVGPF